MKPTRKIAVMTGVIFIIATLVGPILATPLTPDLTGADYLTQISAQPNQVAAGALALDLSPLLQVAASPSPCIRS